MLGDRNATASGGLSVRRRVVYGILLIVLCPLLYLFAWRGMRFFLIPSSSMEPTLMKYDYIATLNYGRPAGNPRRFDIIVFIDPEDPHQNSVKRVIGLPGEIVEVKEGAVYINGEYLNEPYIKEPPVYEYGPDLVPDEHCFMLGDNRNRSSDSSLWRQSVPRSDIIGRAAFIYSPITRMGAIPRPAD
jgi:signal peptidase I